MPFASLSTTSTLALPPTRRLAGETLIDEWAALAAPGTNVTLVAALSEPAIADAIFASARVEESVALKIPLEFVVPEIVLLVVLPLELVSVFAVPLMLIVTA